MAMLRHFLCNIPSNPYLSTVHTQVFSLTWEKKHKIVIFCSVPSQTQDYHMHEPPTQTQYMRVLPGLSAPGLIGVCFM